jgi:hypothetical protein
MMRLNLESALRMSEESKIKKTLTLVVDNLNNDTSSSMLSGNQKEFLLILDYSILRFIKFYFID